MFGGKRYQVLRVYCVLLKVSAVVAIILMLMAAIQPLLTPPVQGGLAAPPANPRFSDPMYQGVLAAIAQAGSMVWAALVALGLTSSIATWALADYLNAHMDTEQNTREMVELMRLRRAADEADARRQLGIPSYQEARRAAVGSLPRYEDTPLGQYSQRQK